MRVLTNKYRNECGHILLTALVMAVTVAIAVGSFAVLVSGQNKSISRSLLWNQGIPVAESGVEEALTQLYYQGTNTPPGNGWTVTNGVFFKQRSVGTNGSYFTVSITQSNRPVITAVGYILQPLSKTKYLSRTVQVKTSKAPSPKGGVVTRAGAVLSGGAYLDSFDSTDPNYSTNGLYTPSKRKDNGQIIANTGGIALNGGGSSGGVYGSVSTGPLGSVTTTGGASVGDTAYITSGNKGVESGHNANDANVDFPAVIAPSTGGTYTPTSGTYNTTNYTYLLQNGSYYTSSSISMSSKQVMAIVGDVTLYVDNSFTTSGQSTIYIYPGATLKMYVSGDLSVAGGGIINSTQKSSALTIYGLNTTAKTWSYSGNSSFVGTIYAPNANLTYNGTADAVGSFTGNTVTIKGNVGLHYDENLTPSYKGYLVTAWNEI